VGCVGGGREREGRGGREEEDKAAMD